MSSETDIQANIRLAVGMLRHARLWRNNVGEAWLGKPIKRTPETVTLLRPRRVVYGLCPGSSDLIGATQVVVTPEMVGTTLAVFTVAEVKRPKVEVPEHQQNFVDFVVGFGGRGAVVRSPEDAIRLVTP